MNFLTWQTGAILAAILIPPLVLLYFLKLRRRSQPIACTILWKRAIEDLHANAPFQRLRRNLLLLLQLLALLLLAGAVMQPQLQAGRLESGRFVLLIDNSASMTATDVEDAPTRLDEAKARATEWIEANYGGGVLSRSPGETMIVAFSDRAQIVARFTRSKRDLLNAIDTIKPTHGESKLDEALKLARASTSTAVDDQGELFNVGELPTLVLFSDGQIADLGDQVLRAAGEGNREQLVYHRVGSEAPDNVAISAISIQRPYDRPTAVEVFVALLNYNEVQTTCDLRLSLDGQVLAVQDVTLPSAAMNPATEALDPGRNNIVFTPFEQPRGAVIEVANLREDVLAADNTVRVVVPPPKRLRVALVSPKSFLVRSVLEGMSLASLDILSDSQFSTLAQRDALSDYDVIVFDNFAPPAEDMKPGRYLIFGATPPVEGFNKFGTHDRQLVLHTRSEHPALRFVGLDDVFISESQLIQPAADVDVIVEGSQGPIMLELLRGSTAILYVTFDPLKSNWPFQRSFVTFVFNAVEYLGHVGEGLMADGLRVGDTLRTRIPAGATDATLRSPDGLTETPEVDPDGSVTWGAVRLTGMHWLNWTVPDLEGEQTRPFAVNLLNEPEGWVTPMETLRVGRDQVAGQGTTAEAYTALWPYALALCLILLMFEWWVYHQRAYI